MKYLKSYSLFESTGWSLEEINRMADAGLMTGAEKIEATRTTIKQILREAGESNPWSERGKALLSSLPAIEAINTPEAEAFFKAGWTPTSTVQQLANATLVWSREIQYTDSERANLWQYSTDPQQYRQSEQLIFYEATGYARHNVGDRLQVMLRKAPGGGLSFYRGAMQELNERWAIEDRFVPNRKTVAQTRAKEAVIKQIREFLEPKFKDHKWVLERYLQFLASGGSAKQLAQRFQIIQRRFPSLPLWGAERYYDELLDKALTDGLPDGVKFWLASPIEVSSWAARKIDLWRKLIDRGLVDTDLSKTITQR